MKNSARALIATAALGGLIMGTTGCASHEEGGAGTKMQASDPSKHACKGQNACKGQGGCKTA